MITYRQSAVYPKWSLSAFRNTKSSTEPFWWEGQYVKEVESDNIVGIQIKKNLCERAGVILVNEIIQFTFVYIF